MPNYAIIRAGAVANVVVKSDKDPWTVPGETAVLVPDGIGIGDTYNGTTFIPRTVPVPPSTKPRTLALEEALIAKGLLTKGDIDNRSLAEIAVP